MSEMENIIEEEQDFYIDNIRQIRSNKIRTQHKLKKKNRRNSNEIESYLSLPQMELKQLLKEFRKPRKSMFENYEASKLSILKLESKRLNLLNKIDDQYYNVGNQNNRSKAGIELHLSDDESEEKKLQDLKKAKKNFDLLLHWSSIECKKHDYKATKQEKQDDQREECNYLDTSIVIDELIKLPGLSNQVPFFTPLKDNLPIVCFEVFNTGSVFVGTGNALGMNGRGMFVFPNGAIYIGQFKDNAFHGIGRIMYPNKTTITGHWFYGKLLNPKVQFSDGLNYKPIDWGYLKYPERRYQTERMRGFLPDNNPQLTNEHPARTIPKDCYDTGEGFYSQKTKCLHNTTTGSFIRIPTKKEVNWIKKNCRNELNPNVKFVKSIFPAQYGFPPVMPKLKINKWHLKNYPELPEKEDKKLRKQIIKDMADFYLTKKNLIDLCVSPLREDPIKEGKRLDKLNFKLFINCIFTEALPFSFKRLLHETKKINSDRIKLYSTLKKSDKLTKKHIDINSICTILNTIKKFINREEIEWSDNLEIDIMKCVNLLRIIDDLFIQTLHEFNVNVKDYKRKSNFISLLKYWLIQRRFQDSGEKTISNEFMSINTSSSKISNYSSLEKSSYSDESVSSREFFSRALKRN